MIDTLPLPFRTACYSSIYLCFIWIVWVELLITFKRIARVVDSIYKPGGYLTISNPNIAPTSIGVDDDSYELGWWSSVTFGGKNNIKVIVISAYRTCILIENMEVSTVHLQKLYSIEQRNQEQLNIGSKMIIDLIIYIKSFLDKQYKILLFIDANKPLVSKSRVTKLFNDTVLIDHVAL